MRNLTKIPHGKPVHEFFVNTWRTMDFVRSHRNRHGYIFRWVDMLSQWPLIVFDMTDPEVEQNHFYPWMWAIARREHYENDTIHDLFWLHEIVHMVTMVYDASVSFDAWANKMCDNEVSASIETEAIVYQELPGLRKKSFERAIWADTYLNNRGEVLRRDVMADRRREAMAHPIGTIEERIADFALENIQWCYVWQENWRKVEAHVLWFRRQACTNPRKALDMHESWLTSPTVGYSDETPYPFPEQAHRWSEVYWKNRNPAVAGY